MNGWRNRMREDRKQAKRIRAERLWDLKSDQSKAAELGYPKSIVSGDSSSGLRSDLYPAADTEP
jgi:hypothetical protein